MTTVAFTLSILGPAIPANAMHYSGLRTDTCGYPKIVQINWESTGEVRLWTYPGNTSTDGTLSANPTSSGQHSYNSGKSSLNWQFGSAPGNVTSWYPTCVSYFRSTAL